MFRPRFLKTITLCAGVGILLMPTPVMSSSPTKERPEERQPTENNVVETISQTPSVAELSDVQPSDWAYQAVVNLVERYEILRGYPGNTFEGQNVLTRYEFATALRQMLDQINEAALTLSADELAIVERLQTEFSQDIAQLNTEIDDLEGRTEQLEAQQFSPTVKFSGQLITAATIGGYSGDRIIAPRGALVTDDTAESFFLNRVALFFNASFDGTDLLQIRLVSGSNGPNDNTAGSLEPNFGSTLDYAVQGRDNSVSMARAFYSFVPTSDLQVVLGPQIVITDYVDSNRNIPPSFRGFSTQSFKTNFVLVPRPLGAGAALDWNPAGGPFSMRAVYVAGDVSNTTGENSALIGGGGSDDVRLFPIAGGSDESGLFGDPHQGFIELEYAPSDTFAIRLQYAGGQIFGSDFDGGGVNAELSVSEQLGFFARYGFSRYSNTSIGELTPQYWMAGFTYADIFRQGDVTGLGVVQPFIEDSVGNATQTNFEAFYDFPITDGMSIAPFAQVVLNPANQDSNGTITAGGIRTVFSF